MRWEAMSFTGTEEELDKLCSDGWEPYAVVCLTSDPTYFLKRSLSGAGELAVIYSHERLRERPISTTQDNVEKIHIKLPGTGQ